MVTVFTQIERQTLEALYPDRDEFFHFLFCLSDRVQEQDDLLADGIRFMCAIRQRPAEWASGGWHWYEGDPTCLHDPNDIWRNYLPLSFDSLCMKDFDSPIPPVELFVAEWVRVSEQTRSQLWVEWAGREVTV